MRHRFSFFVCVCVWFKRKLCPLKFVFSMTINPCLPQFVFSMTISPCLPKAAVTVACQYGQEQRYPGGFRLGGHVSGTQESAGVCGVTAVHPHRAGPHCPRRCSCNLPGQPDAARQTGQEGGVHGGRRRHTCWRKVRPCAWVSASQCLP